MDHINRIGRRTILAMVVIASIAAIVSVFSDRWEYVAFNILVLAICGIGAVSFVRQMKRNDEINRAVEERNNRHPDPQ